MPKRTEDETELDPNELSEPVDPDLDLLDRIREAIGGNEKVFIGVLRVVEGHARPVNEFSFHIEQEKLHLIPDEVRRRCMASGKGEVDFVLEFRNPRGQILTKRPLTLGGEFVPPKTDAAAFQARVSEAPAAPAQEPEENQELAELRARLDAQDEELARVRREESKKRKRREQKALLAPFLAQIDALNKRVEALATPTAPPPQKDVTEEAKKILKMLRDEEGQGSKAVDALRKEIEDMRAAAAKDAFKGELRERDRAIADLSKKLEAIETRRAESDDEEDPSDSLARELLSIRKLDKVWNAGRDESEKSPVFTRLANRIEKKLEGPLADAIEKKIMSAVDGFMGDKKPEEKKPDAKPADNGAPPAPAPEDAKGFGAWLGGQIESRFDAFNDAEKIRPVLQKWPNFLGRLAGCRARGEVVDVLVQLLGYDRAVIEGQITEAAWPALSQLLEVLRGTIARAQQPAKTTTAAGDAQPPAAPRTDDRKAFADWLHGHLSAGCMEIVKPAVILPALERWPALVRELACVDDRAKLFALMTSVGFQATQLEVAIPHALWEKLVPSFGFASLVVSEKLHEKLPGLKLLPAPPPPPPPPAAPAAAAPAPVATPVAPPPPVEVPAVPVTPPAVNGTNGAAA